MIGALIFDLDGTLVQTERLKAVSYARAAAELCPDRLDESSVLEAYRDVVGLSRREVAVALIKRFGLEERARARMAEFGVSSPWQALVQVRLRYYEELIADPKVLRRSQWPHAMALVHRMRARGCRLGLATMSHCSHARRVLAVLAIEDAFDFVATRDDVEFPKPDPEIYRLVARELGVAPAHCLVIEDSASGVRAALAAGMRTLVVPTSFTRRSLEASGLVGKRWIVDPPSRLSDAVRRLMDRPMEHDSATG